MIVKIVLFLLMSEIDSENDSVCASEELRRYFANIRVVTPNKPNRQDPAAAPEDLRPLAVGLGAALCRISQSPMAT